MDVTKRAEYIKRLWNANTAGEIAAILCEYDAELLPDKPQPNWDKAPEWANWWAVDEDGASYWYEQVPLLCVDFWDNKAHTKYKPCDELGFTKNWRETLTKRP